ncbi:MAG: hypothetical protein M9894_19740 [Planctomycetes bacterium]|nr:hypothetical protein [Planctomycetota bacterium]
MLRRAPNLLLGAALTAALVWFGFLVTGTRVDALVGGRPGGLAPLPGSEATHTTVLVDGQPTRVSDCWLATPPAGVLARYEALAAAESRASGAPYVKQEEAALGGGVLVWRAPDGRRRAVFVEADALGRSRYRLLEADPPRAPTRRLPRGLEPPPGVEVVLSLERPGGGGFALVRSPAPVPAAADALLRALARDGLTAEPAALALLIAEGTVSLPLQGADGAARGLLTVGPDGQGGARASLTLD